LRRIDEAGAPERRAVDSVFIIRIECIDAVVLGGDEHDIVRPLIGNSDVGNIERLRVHRPIHWLAEKLDEIIRVDVVKREQLFVWVSPVLALSLCQVNTLTCPMSGHVPAKRRLKLSRRDSEF